jgi:hypothetical protein
MVTSNEGLEDRHDDWRFLPTGVRAFEGRPQREACDVRGQSSRPRTPTAKSPNYFFRQVHDCDASTG